MSTKKYQLDYAGRPLEVEIGRLAKMANAACTVRYGETVVLATACISKRPKPDTDFFPLLVDYREKLFAVGRISSSRWVKREGRPSDEATLTARLIDRSIRPLFCEQIRNDVQVVITVLSSDQENDADIPGLIATSIVLSISDIPFDGPIGAVKVAKIDGELVVNPTFEQRENEDFDVTVVGIKDEIVMLEAGMKEASEQDTVKAIELGLKTYQPVIEFIEKIVKDIKPVKREEILQVEEDEETKAKHGKWLTKINLVTEELLPKLAGKVSKEVRQQMLDKAEDSLAKEFSKDEELDDSDYIFIKVAVEEKLGKLARKLVLEKDQRIDGRKMDQIRGLSAEIGILPRTHGSGLFSRGETQVLSNVTLGPPGAEQHLETLEESEGRKRYMHHYNFPGFSSGEVAPFRSSSRRELGHGALAEKALVSVIPTKEDFPYTIRVVSDVLSSNGSTSQASVCGSTLSLMHAGVPIKNPVAGIAMGLIISEDKKEYKILTDIQGIEDHQGDMDFKVAGTKQGITAVQLDIKLGGISMEIIKDAFEAAKKARLEILEVMNKCISAPNKELSPYAPRIKTIQIDPEKIRDLIGPGGKIINGIIDQTGVDIDIEDDGKVFVTSKNEQGMEEALKLISNVTKEAKEGEVYEGKVTQIITDRNGGGEIGAIVELWPGGDDGMVHISQFRHERISKVSDIVKEGDTLKVKVVGIDKERGRIELSHKVLLPRTESAGRPQRTRRDFDDNRPQRKDSKKRFFRKD